MPHRRKVTPPCLTVSPSVMVWAKHGGCNGESHRDQRKPAEQRQSSPQAVWVGFRCLRPPNTLAWLAEPVALTISKMHSRTLIERRLYGTFASSSRGLCGR